MKNTFLARVDRVRGPLANGYMTQQDAFDTLVASGATPEDAFLAVKGAIILNRSRA